MEVREITEERFIECMAIDFPNFKITKSNLTHPTSQFVISFYTLILGNAIELNDPEEIWNVTEDQRSFINSYHAEAATFGQHVWAHNLHSAIQYVFNHLSENGSEFVYSDILFPENTPRRSFVFMALMLNFYWYTNDLADDLSNDVAACVEKVDIKKNLKLEIEKLTSQLRELEFQRCQYADSYKDKNKQVRKSQEANEEKEVVMRNLLTEKETIKRELDKVDEEMQKLQMTLTKYQNEKEYFESLIVSNENQVKDVHENRTVKKDECVKRMKILEEQVKEASCSLVRKNKILELQQKLNQSLREESFSQEPHGMQRGFQNLYDSVMGVNEKKKKLSEEEMALDLKLLEAEEAVSKMKDEFLKINQDMEECTVRGKSKIDECTKAFEEVKKNHSQLFVKVRKESEHSEEIQATKSELSAKYSKLEKSIGTIDSVNKSMYKNYAKEMKATLDSLEGIFGEQKKDIFHLHSAIFQ